MFYNQLKQADRVANITSNIQLPENRAEYQSKSKQSNKFEEMW